MGKHPGQKWPGDAITDAVGITGGHKHKQRHTESSWSRPASNQPQTTQVPISQMPKTVLSKGISAGATVIEVASSSGIGLGDTIMIGDEYNAVKGFGSIILDHPMNRGQPRGSTVQVVHQKNPPTTAPPAATQPLMKAASPSIAPATLAPTQAPHTKVARILFYVALAGVPICCCILIGAAAAIMLGRNKKKKKHHHHHGHHGRSSDDDDVEYYSGTSEEEEEPLAYEADDRYNPYPMDHQKTTQMYLQGY